jgi:apolipoprotein D and lipocalin family protein
MLLHFVFLTTAAAFAVTPVPELDTQRYLGRWYQAYSDFSVVATFENSSYCVTADYGLNLNGTISVENRERNTNISGPERRILGWAEAKDPSKPGELTVNLQTTQFGAPYWVLALGPETYEGYYYEYAVVSDPFLFTLFVLTRNLTTFAERWQQPLLQNLTNLGFTQFWNTPIATEQEGCVYWP